MIKFLYVIFMNLFRAPYIIPKMRYQANHPEKYPEQKRYGLVRHVIALAKRTGCISTRSYGRENLPEEGGYVMFANHQGKYDALGIIMSHEEPCSFIMDKKKSDTILVREIVDLVQGKRMDKNDIRQALSVINEVSDEVKEGRRYIIFPEGGYTFNNKNRIGIFKPGSFKCAVKAKAPIVPVALIDSYKAFNSFTLGKVNTQVHFLNPLYYDDYKGLKTVDIAKMVQARIKEAIILYGPSN